MANITFKKMQKINNLFYFNNKINNNTLKQNDSISKRHFFEKSEEIVLHLK